MDDLKVGNYIKHLRKLRSLTQKELADVLNISFQAVSKWETGECLPDTALLLPLCDVLETSVDKLLNGGCIVASERRPMRVEDVVVGFEMIENIGRCFGEGCTFYTGMIEGINEKMNIDLLDYLGKPETREVMYAEVLIQGIMNGRTVDMDEVRAAFKNKRMIEMIEKYLEKTADGVCVE